MVTGKTWKLSIKPESKNGYSPFDFCKDHGFIGIGWHHAYPQPDGTHLVPESAKQALAIMHAFPDWKGHSLRVAHAFLEQVKPGDHVWVHQGKAYWLCVVGEGLLFGSQISSDYQKYDLGQARPARWIEIETPLINGSVQRGCIAPITLQSITTTLREWESYQFLHSKRVEDKNWQPSISHDELLAWLEPEYREELLSILTPDDVEDLVAYHLQSEGWMIRKSTCFRSNPTFEFELRSRDGQRAFVQVKTGQVSLDASSYLKEADRGIVFLCAAQGQVRNEGSHPNIRVIEFEHLVRWIGKNPWSLGDNIRLRLALIQEWQNDSRKGVGA